AAHGRALGAGRHPAAARRPGGPGERAGLLRRTPAHAGPPARPHAVRPLPQRRVAGERLRLLGGPMNATIAKLALQALLGRRRFWLLLAFPILLVALTVLLRVLAGDADPAWT